MNREGREFLQGACDAGKRWAERYDTLAEAWQACSRSNWMIWALSELGGTWSHVRGLMSASEIRATVGNPFPEHLCCFFCCARMSEEESRYSDIVGSLPRCREHLKEVGLDLAA